MLTLVEDKNILGMQGEKRCELFCIMNDDKNKTFKKYSSCNHQKIKCTHALIISNARKLKFWDYRVYSNRTQAKKIISNLDCAQLKSKQFQEVNFLALIRCCVVIERL